jgi:hypothetical protein
MNGKLVRPALGLLCSLVLMPACQTIAPMPAPALSSVPPSLSIPKDVERLAVMHVRTPDHDILTAYTQLHGAAFQLKERRPSLTIVERLDLDAIMDEQRLHMNGMVSDDTAVHVGRILGADAVLLYYIEGPTSRDKVLARLDAELPPFVLSSKLIKVQTGEIVYFNVVTIPLEKWNPDVSFFSIESYL